jgi:hydrogenase-4 component F
MTGALLLLLLVVVGAPLVAVALCALLRSTRLCEAVNLAAAIASFAAALPLPMIAWSSTSYFAGGYVLLDAAAAWTVVCTAVVYLLASIYAVGYMRLLEEERPRMHRFYALFAGFAFTMLCGPLMNNVGVYWIAIELTTLVSTFLVGFERGHEAVEAAWKYIIVVSAGISLALLGTVLFYWAGSLVIGPTYDMTWGALREVAPRMDPTLVRTAFLLVLVGYGTKAGLAPMHTWLPDAHSEGPAPVSAMLSGALLNTAMLGVARFLSIADAASTSALPRAVVVAFGVFSLFVAGLFIVRQEGVKRLMAYSSVEHMGVLALGFGFGGALGIAGALYHMLNHSLNKSLMFFGAGAMMRAYQTKEMPQIQSVGRRYPVIGALWLAGAVAITGAPPFGLFLSEITIMRAGLGGPHRWAVWLMLLLLIVIFIGFLNHFREMYFVDPPPGAAAPTLRPSAWITVPMWLALIPVLVLGVWWPEVLWQYFAAVAAELAGLAR